MSGIENKNIKGFFFNKSGKISPIGSIIGKREKGELVIFKKVTKLDNCVKMNLKMKACPEN